MDTQADKKKLHSIRLQIKTIQLQNQMNTWVHSSELW